MKVILRKNKCLIAIEDRLANITADKSNEMNKDIMTNLYWRLDSEVLSNIEEKKIAKEI